MIERAKYTPQPPDRPPTHSDLADRDEFQRLVDLSLPGVQASAETWGKGLAAFITLITTSLVIKGPDVVGSLPVGWRIAVTGLVALSLGLGVFGLWQTLAAQAGIRSMSLTLPDIQQRFGTVPAFRVAMARRGAHRLDLARTAVAASVVSLLLGVGLTWWAPTQPNTPSSPPPAFLRIQLASSSLCGVLESADGSEMRLGIAGQHTPVIIPLDHVRNLSITSTCS